MGSLHNIFVPFFLYSMIFSCMIRSDAQLLPAQEVQALQEISSKLNNKHWKTLNQSSCSRPRDFNVTFHDDIFSNVRCDCSFNNNSVCHVTHIEMKGLNLTGELPAEFANLTDLLMIDLSRNFINGSIPRAFGQLHLTNLSLMGNRIHGLIPAEIGNIDTLEELELENNQLEGPLPVNLGNLSHLKKLLLSGNIFSGTIPETYGNLKNLTDFRIDGSGLSGKIPDFIGNWTNITRLDLQGTGMSGPIPLAISCMKNLEQLRISDLSGTDSTIPDLKDMRSLKTLILRNCLISGAIPEYMGHTSKLKTLDLSFNKLTGQIPDPVTSVKYLYLNNNSLTGAIPIWISTTKKNFDVSYNNFTETPKYSCQPSHVNLVSSHSSLRNNSVAWCLKKDLPCSRKPQYYSLFINCGGSKTEWEGNEYEDDSVRDGPSYFFSNSEKWAYGSAGVFMGNKKAFYVAMNSNVTAGEIYKTARLAPSSLKYYGLCLRKGSYKVRLHFAEIQYSDDNTFSSIGRRIFDVSIQGKVVWKNFNIAEAAKGFGLPTTLESNVTVDYGTLEIHLYWAGKGTNAVPNKGVYGPLISAITVTPIFTVDTGRLSTGAVAGIVVGSISGVTLILLILWRKGFLGVKDIEDKELRGAIELQTGYFSLRQIKAATNNFDPANKIGEGGFGPVYKGILSDDAVIAVKQLSSKSKQGNREFINEIGMISALQHPNLVKLFGCCIEGNQLLLIYEYMENNSLARALFGQEEKHLNLDWPTRKKIFLHIARGLAYLHEESRLKIVHRDIKATNVLLDKDHNAKISDFGLAKLDEEENTHISTRIAGTIGYMAPEYALRGYLTDKADVYSFGIVALEIVSGKGNTNYRPKQEFVNLLDWGCKPVENMEAVGGSAPVSPCSSYNSTPYASYYPSPAGSSSLHSPASSSYAANAHVADGSSLIPWLNKLSSASSSTSSFTSQLQHVYMQTGSNSAPVSSSLTSTAHTPGLTETGCKTPQNSLLQSSTPPNPACQIFPNSGWVRGLRIPERNPGSPTFSLTTPNPFGFKEVAQALPASTDQNANVSNDEVMVIDEFAFRSSIKKQTNPWEGERIHEEFVSDDRKLTLGTSWKYDM